MGKCGSSIVRQLAKALKREVALEDRVLAADRARVVAVNLLRTFVGMTDREARPPSEQRIISEARIFVMENE